MSKGSPRKGQVALFVFLALIVVAGVGLYFLLRGSIDLGSIPVRFQELNQYYLDCSKESTEIGVGLLEKQAGFISPPEFSPGSEFAPTSSQLDFFGAAVPYWYYVSGNNIAKEQVPTRKSMEEQLAGFVEGDLERCSLQGFADKGFLIDRGKPSVGVSIKDEHVTVEIRNKISASFGDEKVILEKFSLTLPTKLGKFYDIAYRIYQHEKQNAFLEQYGVDALRLYAPVDNVEITCAPKVWTFDAVREDIQTALEANVPALRVQGNYYKLKNDRRKYFVVPVKSDEQVNFVYSKFWPMKIEANPVENGLLVAEPVGQGAGLGALGFCYVPYHFVYDLHYPVMIQILDDKEIFQFPVVVVIDKNKPREALEGEAVGDVDPPLCNQKVQDIEIYTYNTLLEPVKATVDFKCLNQRCDLGETKVDGKDAVFRGRVPQCVNGYLIATAPGYAEERLQISTNTQSTGNIVMDKLYNLSVALKVDEKDSEDFVLIYFTGEKSITIAYPEQKSVELSEGFYNLTVYVYRNSTLTLGEHSETKCVTVPKKGVLGFLGGEDEECFDITVPAQTVSSVVIGGGKAEYYFVESELQQGKILELGVDSFPTPSTVEDLPNNYNLVEIKDIDVVVK